MKQSQKISDWIKKQVLSAGAKGCVVGLSGGVDSAVVAVLCKKAFPKTTMGLIMPCHSFSEDAEHARLLAETHRLQTIVVDLTIAFDDLYKNFEKRVYSQEKGLAIANLKPRLRMLSLYYFANKQNYLVIGTGNKSELNMGYFTKYGDGGVDLLPLGGLLKSQVKKLAAELRIPQDIIDKPPSAGLWHGQTDETEMGVTYAELDKAITALETNKTDKCDQKTLRLLKSRQKVIQHKLTTPPIFQP